MNQRAGYDSRPRTRASALHKYFKGPGAMKPGFFYRLRLRAALVLPAAAALLLASCDPPASPSSAVPEVTRISGLPNMAEIERRFNDQYAASARSTDGVSFALDEPEISPDGKTVIRAKITYAAGKLALMKIGGTEHRIKTVTITRVVDGKTIPTTVEYKDKDDTARKTVTSRYVPPPNAAANNARQSLEGGARLAETAGEGGPALHISGEEKDGAGKTLRTFTATEEIQGGTTILETTYRRPEKEGFTETVTTENGVLTQKVETYSAGAAPAKDRTPPAKDETKTETITYEKSARAMFYPAEAKRLKAVAVYKDADGAATKTIETTPTDEGGELVVTKDAEDREVSRVETTTKDGVTAAVHKKPDGTVIKREETKTTAEGAELVVTKGPDDKEVSRVETTTKDGVTAAVHKKPDGTVIKREETKTTAEGAELVVTKGPDDKEVSRVETKKDGSTITTTPNPKGGTLAVYKNPGGTLIKSVETKSDGSTITTETTAGGITKELVIHPSVTAIGELEFADNQLTSLIIGSGVKTIGERAFLNNKLTSLTIGNGVKTIGEWAFADNQLTRLTIPPSVTAIGNRAFQDNSLISLTIGNGVKTIGEWAFLNNQLTRLTIPPSVTAIGDRAFQDNSLISLTIGNGVKTIGGKAFSNNPRLKTVTITGRGPVNSNAFANKYSSRLTKGIFPESGSSGIELIIQEGITAIGEEAFYKNQLTSLRIPPSVTAIGNYAFHGNRLTALYIPSSVTAIGEGAFHTNQLTRLTIPPSVTAIGDYAFHFNQLIRVILTRVLYEARGTAFNRNPAALRFYDHKGGRLGGN